MDKRKRSLLTAYPKLWTMHSVHPSSSSYDKETGLKRKQQERMRVAKGWYIPLVMKRVDQRSQKANNMVEEGNKMETADCVLLRQ